MTTLTFTEISNFCNKLLDEVDMLSKQGNFKQANEVLKIYGKLADLRFDYYNTVDTLA